MLEWPDADPARVAQFNDQVEQLCRRLDSTERRIVELRSEGYSTAEIAEHLSSLSPIDDVRATAGYRREAASVLVRRALESCGGDR